MPLTLKVALENYRLERLRIRGGPHPSLACSCGQCDVIRAADLLYELAREAAARAAVPPPWWERFAEPGFN